MKEIGSPHRHGRPALPADDNYRRAFQLAADRSRAMRVQIDMT